MYDQAGYEIRFGWGPQEAAVLGAAVEALVVVDVLRFTTAVDAAVSRGVEIEPQASHRGPDDDSPYTLSPASFAGAPAGIRVVLPSPNGSAISAAAASGGATVYAGCLRNAPAVGAALAGRTVAVIAAGERWRDDRSLRPCLEDLLGAGAVLAALAGSRSPEASAAAAAFEAMAGDLAAAVRDCASGRELAVMGLAADVETALQHGVSATVPVLRDGAFAAAEGQ